MGKSEVAVAVAESLDAEIVSVDSIQIYRGLDAGTAKPSPDLLERAPHHLIDALEPSHELTVADYQRRARAAVEEISSRGRLPLLVGGSGLYFRAVVDDLDFPPRAGAIAGKWGPRGSTPGCASSIPPRRRTSMRETCAGSCARSR